MRAAGEVAVCQIDHRLIEFLTNDQDPQCSMRKSCDTACKLCICMVRLPSDRCQHACETNKQSIQPHDLNAGVANDAGTPQHRSQ